VRFFVRRFTPSSLFPQSANISTTAAEMTFNGNDAVGLFKNGVLIDIIEPSMAERLILLPM
jgi:hypothetical protein